jgi:hypothetical protein
MDFLTTCTHDSEVQVITAPPLISMIHKAPQNPQSLFPVRWDSNSHWLATAFNSRDSSVSRAHVVTVRRISSNWIYSTGLGSRLYSIGTDPTENIESNSSSIVVMNGCLAIAWKSFTCLSRIGCSLSQSLHSNGTIDITISVELIKIRTEYSPLIGRQGGRQREVGPRKVFVSYS